MTRAHGGTGWGQAKQAIDGGAVGFESVEGQGSTFLADGTTRQSLSGRAIPSRFSKRCCRGFRAPASCRIPEGASWWLKMNRSIRAITRNCSNRSFSRIDHNNGAEVVRMGNFNGPVRS